MWFVYVIEAQSGAYYTGVTTDINARFRKHAGEIRGGAKFFRGNPPTLLLYLQQFRSRSAAQKREAYIKQLNRLQKERIIFYAPRNSE